MSDLDAAFQVWLDAVRDGDADRATEALMWRAHLARKIAKAEGKEAIA